MSSNHVFRMLVVVAVGTALAAHGSAAADKERPSCMHCGATCGLVAVCECTPGKKKTQKTEYDTTCDPVCVPGCSGFAWPWSRHGAGCADRATGCTAGCSTEGDADCCRAWVRQRKKLVKEIKDEEQQVIERKVVWICRSCTVGCAAPSRPAANASGWWPAWLRWPYTGQ